MLASLALIAVGFVCLLVWIFGNGDNSLILILAAAVSLLLGFATRHIIQKVDPEGTEKLRSEAREFFPRGMLECDLPEPPDHSRLPAFFRFLDKLRPLYDWTYKIVLFVCKLLLIGDIFITSWSVLGRYSPVIEDPHWSEDIVLTFMVYMAVLSATLAIRRRSHIRMTAFDSKLPEPVIKVLDLVADITVMALGAVLLVYGIKACNSPLIANGKYTSLPKLSKIWQYLPIPVAGAGMIIFELEQVVQRIESFFLPKTIEKEAKKA